MEEVCNKSVKVIAIDTIVYLVLALLSFVIDNSGFMFYVYALMLVALVCGGFGFVYSLILCLKHNNDCFIHVLMTIYAAYMIPFVTIPGGFVLTFSGYLSIFVLSSLLIGLIIRAIIKAVKN